LSLLLNISGLYVSYLLILKQLRIRSNQADKLCSLFKQNDCNDVLDSKAAKLWGVIGWSEVGLSYFISNIIIILFIPQFMPYLALINICALPYSFWSVWYQKFKAKTWCPLCLLVMGILWGIFILNLIFGYIAIPELRLDFIFGIFILYSLPFVLINLTLPLITNSRKLTEMTRMYNSLKKSDEVFDALLKKETQYPVDRSTSRILFGNPEADILVTILTNPHCEPCGRMHTRVEKLLNEIRDKVCIQYVFSSFSKDLDSSCNFLIQAYMHNNKEKWEKIYRNWFDEGKYDRENFFASHGYEPGENLEEYERHKKWKEKTGISATPTVLINGYKLPQEYRIEDLKYFTKISQD
ncbi:thioredoxin domain-containing protein, partial [Bacteroidales bacterium OttesenSCG-928-A17]|nr:thioredoxin domain-containing protein [Bacteroidales bacterium OttesenSCG-928-A17]